MKNLFIFLLITSLQIDADDTDKTWKALNNLYNIEKYQLRDCIAPNVNLLSRYPDMPIIERELRKNLYALLDTSNKIEFYENKAGVYSDPKRFAGTVARMVDDNLLAPRGMGLDWETVEAEYGIRKSTSWPEGYLFNAMLKEQE